MNKTNNTKKEMDRKFIESLLKSLNTKKDKVEIQYYCSASGK